MSLASRWRHTAWEEEKQVCQKNVWPFEGCVSVSAKCTLGGGAAVVGVYQSGRDSVLASPPH